MLADTYFDGLSDDFLDVVKGVSSSTPAIVNTIAVAKGLPPPYASNQPSGSGGAIPSYSSGMSARTKELLLLLGIGAGVFAVGYYFTKGKR